MQQAKQTTVQTPLLRSPAWRLRVGSYPNGIVSIRKSSARELSREPAEVNRVGHVVVKPHSIARASVRS